MPEKNETCSRRRLSSEEEQLTKKKKRIDRRGKMFARQDNDETAVAESARVLTFLALMDSICVNPRKEFVSRDVNASINIQVDARCQRQETRGVDASQLGGTASQARSLEGKTELDSSRRVK
jgi:hypothetical protein